MKKNNKGFTMLETLIASTLIISTLVFLYVQFNNFLTSTHESFEFNTVEGIHKARQLAQYYKKHPSFQCNSYIEKPCINDRTTVSEIYQLLGVSNSILIYDSPSQNLDFSSVNSICNETCQKFIKNVRTDTSETRLIVIYNDQSFATMLIE